ncbi:MAG: transcriptional repressor, partial [Anaerolineae bacterium]|nr:transcriptional repressor [Anaerolineae bacterium]
ANANENYLQLDEQRGPKRMNQNEGLLASFQAGGHRLTRQRRVLLEVLEESREHLDAEALYERARQRVPRLSLATVYRTLAMLKRMGLVAEYSLGETHGHFEAIQTGRHYHFTCLGCGEVMEFDAPQVEDALRELAVRARLEVCGVHFFITGYCARCREERDG